MSSDDPGAPREFLRIHSRRDAAHEFRGFQHRRGLHHRIEWIDAGNGKQLHRLALLLCERYDAGEKLPLVVGEKLFLAQRILSRRWISVRRRFACSDACSRNSARRPTPIRCH